MSQTFIVSPSDLTFLFRECARCFWRKVVLGVRRPSIPLPPVFTLLDRAQKKFFMAKHTSALGDDLPAGRVLSADVVVRSLPIPIAPYDVKIVFRGSLDLSLALDSGAYGVVDLKTTEPKRGLADFYSPQLHAYALALENPADGREPTRPVDVLGLLCFEPKEMVSLSPGALAYKTTAVWRPVERDDASFLAFLVPVAEVLAWPAPPKPDPKCPWCSVLAAAPLRPSLEALIGSVPGQ